MQPCPIETPRRLRGRSVDETTTVTEHNGKHHGPRPPRRAQQASRDETATPSSTLPIHQSLGIQAVQRRLGTGAITPNLVASAQRTVGNAVVQRLLRHRIVYAEATHDQPRDGLAPVAGRVARAVTRAPVREPTTAVRPSAAGTVVRRDPDTTKPGAGAGAFRFEREGFVFFDARSDGIRFLVGVPIADERASRTALPALGQRIAKDNALIKDPAFQVATCIITNTSSRLALWKGRPTLVINRVEADTETVAHEMGHALFYALEHRAQSKEPDAKPAGNFRGAVADVFNRLSTTKTVTKKVHTRVDGKIVEEERDEPAGLWVVDPSQWRSGKQPLREHPWDDPDEFFGSAKAAYQIDRAGLEKAIARFKKIDPSVEAPMKDLLALLDALFTKSELPASALSEKGPAGDGPARETAAVQALRSVKPPSNVENATDAGVQLLIASA
jgi:hypothetical protein